MLIRRLGSWNVALAIAGAAALIIEGEIRAKGSLSAGSFVLAVAASAPLAWRTRAPLAALAGVAVGAVLCDAAFDAGVAATGLVMVELYTVARLGDRQRSLVVGAVTASAVILAIVLVEGAFDTEAAAVRVPLVFAALAVGDTVRSRQALRAAAQERAEREEREREQESHRRAVQERMRIARELHDTLAIIMVVVFLAFVLSTDRTIKMIGLGMATAIAIDALVVRTVLVPAIMHTFGPANWRLPEWLDRRLPHLDVEGEVVETPAPDALPLAA